jgi:hypothetical protein
MRLTDNQIKEIAELLECGHQCFVHKPTGAIEYHPDPLGTLHNLEPWQDLIDKIEENWDDYERFETMVSSQTFLVMEDFVNSLDNDDIKKRLEYALSRPKPFRNFKYEIDQSDHRQSWFDFRLNANIEWVKEQLEEKAQSAQQM